MNGGWKERDEGWRQRKEDEECNESDYVTEGGITRASFRKTASSLPDARNPFWFRRMLGIMQSAACSGGGAAIILQSWRRNEREKVLGLFIHFVMSPTNAKCLLRHRTSPVAWQQSGEKARIRESGGRYLRGERRTQTHESRLQVVKTENVNSSEICYN